MAQPAWLNDPSLAWAYCSRRSNRKAHHGVHGGPPRSAFSSVIASSRHHPIHNHVRLVCANAIAGGSAKLTLMATNALRQ